VLSLAYYVYLMKKYGGAPFHAAALAAGGRDTGAPGLRPKYHADYYGAFVIGPGGHNIQAVGHQPEVG
jgi:hypothetical protein